MRPKERFAALATLSVLALVSGVGAAVAGEDDGDLSLTSAEAERASRAALEYTGGGKVNAVERDREQGATWEVEIARPDGSQVDVRLSDDYRLVVIEEESAKD